MESKALRFEVKAKGITTNAAGQEVGQIECYGAMFGSTDDDNDRINKGAFARTIKNSKSRAVSRNNTPYFLKMLWQHNRAEVIGGWSDVSEDEIGLKAKGDILLATQRGREYYELARAGMVDEFSILYDVPSNGAKYAKDGVRDLNELRLFSIDPVTFAANDETYVVSVKSAEKKDAAMNPRDKTRAPKEAKTFQEHYAEEQCQDLLEDWQDVVLCALTCSVLDAIKIGDTPQADIADALAGFGAAVMEWVAEGQKYGLSAYLASQTYSSGSADYTMQYGTESKPDYGYMSRRTPLASKAGRAISAANSDKIQGHIDALTKAADDHMMASKATAKAIRSSADDLATILQGSEAAYGTDAGTADGQEGKSSGAPYRLRTRATPTPPSAKVADTAAEDELTAAISKLKTVRISA